MLLLDGGVFTFMLFRAVINYSDIQRRKRDKISKGRGDIERMEMAGMTLV